MRLLGSRGRLTQHLTCDGVHLSKWNIVELANILDKTS